MIISVVRHSLTNRVIAIALEPSGAADELFLTGLAHSLIKGEPIYCSPTEIAEGDEKLDGL